MCAMSSNKYMREYMAKRYTQRMNEARVFLGGKCNKCSSTESLEFDHLDRKTKGFTIAKLWGVSKKRFWEEVSKCQLLCKGCHIEKSLEESGLDSAKGIHGTLSSYRYCHCELCKEAKRLYWDSNKEKYYKSRKLKRTTSSIG